MNTTEQALIDLGLLDRVETFLTLDADLKTISTALSIATRSMYYADASNVQVVEKICKASARLFRSVTFYLYYDGALLTWTIPEMQTP